MKILFLSQIVPYPPHGGVLQRGFNVIRQMNKYYDIHLLAFVHPDILTSQTLIDESCKELSQYCINIEYFELWPKKTSLHKLFALLLGLFTSDPFSVLAHRSKTFQHRFTEILASGDIDIVHFDTIGLVRLYYDDMPCPAILTHHNIESQLMERRAIVEKNSIKKFYLDLQSKRLKRYEDEQSPKFSCNVMMSEIDAATLKIGAPAAVTSIIPNGVDTEYFRPRPGSETKALIYTGGMNMFANKDAVLYFLDEIWPLVKQKCPECVFYAVGQDPPEELLKIAQNNPSVKITGYVDDVRPLIAKSQVYVVPLRVGGGTRLKVIDAMAQGKAIVSTSIGCEGISVSPGKNIIIADTPSLFAQEIITLLNDRNKCQKLGNTARDMVTSRYSWDIIGEEIEELYNRIIEKSS